MERAKTQDRRSKSAHGIKDVVEDDIEEYERIIKRAREEHELDYLAPAMPVKLVYDERQQDRLSNAHKGPATVSFATLKDDIIRRHDGEHCVTPKMASSAANVDANSKPIHFRYHQDDWNRETN